MVTDGETDELAIVTLIFLVIRFIHFTLTDFHFNWLNTLYDTPVIAKQLFNSNYFIYLKFSVILQNLHF